MAVNVPEWLSKRGGGLTQSTDGHTWFVTFGKEAQYRLAPAPVAGKFGCRITQTINGRRFDSASTHPSADDAVCAGLEDLRKALGW